MFASAMGSAWLLAAGLCLSSWAGMPSGMIPVGIGLSIQEPAAPAAEATRAKPRRLPTYFSRVVSEKQRTEIYAIQDRFETELQAIQEQLDAKIKERDAAILAVLDPDQLAEVQRLTAEAAKKREERRSGPSSTESSESEGGNAPR